MNTQYQLDERAELLLRHLIASYSENAQPVGSKNLAELSGLEVSSATIRNIMAKLEDLGLVDSPHTSAGRIPTEAGYRFFIDRLLQVNDLESNAHQTIAESLGRDKTTGDLLISASEILSNVTHLAGVISHTQVAPAEIRHLEFMSLGDRRLLVIMVINKDEVHNKVIRVERDYSETELYDAAKVLSRYLVGTSFDRARQKLVRELSELRSNVNDMLQSVLDAMQEMCDTSADEALLTAGEFNLLQFDELSNINKLKDIFKVFSDKTDMLRLLDHCTSAEGVEIFIGSELGYSVLQDCAVIGAPYRVDGDVVGVLGVIGPTRIPYEQVIPVVDVTAKLLSSALNTQK